MRIAIVGNSGSGKSTLARRLAEIDHAEVLDLYTVAWAPGQIAVARAPDEAAADVRAFCAAHDSWIVEGCYTNLIEAALAFDPLLLFLNPGAEQCLEHCRARPWEPHKYASRQEQDDRLAMLLAWVEGYYHRDGEMSLREHQKCFDRYAGRKEMLVRVPDVDSLGAQLQAWTR